MTPPASASAPHGISLQPLCAEDLDKNQQSSADGDISASDSIVRVLVIPAQEDWMLARECWRLLQPALS